MRPQKFLMNVLKAGVMCSAAGMMMGNQSCQQQPEATRELKRIIDMGKLTAPSITLPQGGTFDFQYVANQQVYSVMQTSDHFALRYGTPVVPTSSTATEAKTLNLSNNDRVMMKAAALNAGVSEKPVMSKEAECLVNLPNERISGSVNSFEMIGGAGVQIGFNAAGPLDVSGLTGLGFSIQWAQLALSMFATNPLTAGVMSSANVTADQTKTSVNFTLNVGAFSVGPSAYYQTPLAKVTENGLIKAADALYTGLENSSEGEWYTRVLMDQDTHLVIIGGKDVGVKVGDQFNVYNEYAVWDGDPCNSKYYGSAPSDPVATIQIDTVGDYISFGKVTVQTDENPVIGAKVRVLKLVSDTTATSSK